MAWLLPTTVTLAALGVVMLVGWFQSARPLEVVLSACAVLGLVAVVRARRSWTPAGDDAEDHGVLLHD